MRLHLSHPAALLAGALVASVSSGSAAQGESPPAAPAKLVHANAPLLWIYPEPNKSKQAIGYARAGQALRLAAAPDAARDRDARRSTSGCAGAWRAVEPHGFVCLDDAASLEPTRYSASLQKLAPRTGPWPFHYALSLGSASYRRLPTRAESRRSEARFAPTPSLPAHWSGYAELADGDHAPPSPTPDFLLENGSVSRAAEGRLTRRDVPAGSLIAYTSVFEHDGRTWLQNADGTVVPADRTQPFRTSAFAGVDLKEAGLTLPFAFTRGDAVAREPSGAPGCDLGDAANANGRLEATARTLAPGCVTSRTVQLAPRTPLALSGQVVELESARWLVARRVEQATPLLVRQDTVRVAEKRARPFSSRESWIAFSIQRGVLVTYEDDEPTFVTLASPGAGGVPRASDGSEWRTTPTGFHRVQFKHRSDDMSPEWGEHRSHFVADVPHVLYFAPPFAIHVAYWHERFGEPMSGGCINVSPRDGERLFGWTSPAVPAEWHGVGASPRTGAGTAIWIDRY